MDKAPPLSTDRVRRKRAKALAEGLCTRCCCREAVPGRRTCEPCSAAAKQRVSRSRTREKERRGAIDASSRVEAAGDVAVSEHAYGEAVRLYGEALATALSAADDGRISEKLGRALFCTSRPDKARTWLERAITQQMAAGGTGEDALLSLPRQYWLEANTPECLVLIGRAHALLSENANGE